MPSLVYGIVSKSFNEASPSAGTTGIEFRIPQSDIGFMSWSTSFLTNPSAVVIELQVSNDQAIWTTIDSSSNILGEVRQLYIASQYVRAKHVSRTGGTGVSVLFNVLPASSNFISGVRSLKGQFEVLQNPLLSDANKPVIRITTVNDNPWGLVIGNENFSPVPNAGLAMYASSIQAGIASQAADGVSAAPLLISGSEVTISVDPSFGSFNFNATLTSTTFSSLGSINFTPQTTMTLAPVAGDVVINKNVYLGAEVYLSGREMSSPPSAANANQGVLFFRDNGSGKTQLCVVFNTGAVQVIATQP